MADGNTAAVLGVIALAVVCLLGLVLAVVMLVARLKRLKSRPARRQTVAQQLFGTLLHGGQLQLTANTMNCQLVGYVDNIPVTIDMGQYDYALMGQWESTYNVHIRFTLPEATGEFRERCRQQLEPVLRPFRGTVRLWDNMALCHLGLVLTEGQPAAPYDELVRSLARCIGPGQGASMGRSV